MSQNQNIPLLTDLVTPGNPKLKISEKEKRALTTSTSQTANLNMRIDEIETAIGQDTSGPIGRAFAIRAEGEQHHIKKPAPTNPSK